MFCSKCGNQIADGSAFCNSCGAPVGQPMQVASQNIDEGATRKKVFVGEIHKCPSCGQELKGFEAMCPACGAELNKKENASLQKFVKDINDVDAEITNNAARAGVARKKFWTDWSGGKKFWYVVLCIYTFGIPIWVHLLKTTLVGSAFLKLDVYEQKKRSIIVNYVVGSNREDIMEFLTFAQSQRNQSYAGDDKRYLWKKIWNDKYAQIIDKAIPLYGADTEFVSFLSGKKKEAEDYQKTLTKKAVMPLAILVVAIAAFIGFVAFQTSGIGVKLEKKEKTLSAQNIELSGSFKKYLAVSSAEATLQVDVDNEYVLVMSFEVKANESLKDAKDVQIQNAIKEKNWDSALCSTSYCEVRNYGDSSDLNLIFSGKSIGADNSDDVISVLMQLEKDETKKISLRFSKSDIKEWKKQINEIMNQESLEIGTKVVYEIIYKENGKNSYHNLTIE